MNATGLAKHFNEDSDCGDSSHHVVNLIRFFIAVFAGFSFIPDAFSLPEDSIAKVIAFSGYLIFSLAILIASKRHFYYTNSRYVIWADIAWHGALIALTGPLSSILLPLFLFSILVFSMQFGAKEGIQSTAASTILYVTLVMSQDFPDGQEEWAQLVLRTMFLLSLGLMITNWGGSQALLRRRLTLLREVSLVSNPRFGIDHTVASVMEKIRAFFDAEKCILVYRNGDNSTYFMRQTSATAVREAIYARPLSADLALLLLPSNINRRVGLYKSFSLARLSKRPYCCLYDLAIKEWNVCNPENSAHIANILNATSFISAPLQLRKNSGRIYILSNRKSFTTNDAIFLSQITEQAFSVISSVDLVDQLASEAAEQERRRIIGDLHDTTIQSYIGLRLGLEALRTKVEPHNSLAPVIDQLIKMSNDVIDELRSYVSNLKEKEEKAETTFVASIRRQVAKFHEFYGINIDVLCEDEIHINDRLAAEALQIVKEGLSNIRKHTLAQNGTIKVICSENSLSLKIQNEEAERNNADFTPRSISERAQALGGRAWVEQEMGSLTTVVIEIPI
ncbi:histidine kinase [Oxalobacteraceae bacterium R-40]|uniref:Histidine kinase n=1 Tax=Keguizhuia sedimenti TaxID=3064264 RepID=A0ABU1BIS8_9BURK|nr:histidine kinase [Oxalobacteraceae bacterium R-40]